DDLQHQSAFALGCPAFDFFLIFHLSGPFFKFRTCAAFYWVNTSMRCERVSSLGGQLATRSGAGIAGQSDTKLRWMRRLVFSSRVAVVVDEKARTRRAWSGGAASNKCRSNRSC
ncbi:hypothetical protein, partial [Comamonas aquatica]|uniref:hypothetical protein n=1 Tax=Comamonas aquatica TaxID=225991 RepID=UPI001EF2902E